MRFLAGLMICLLPVQGLALSCLPQTVPNVYTRIAEAAETYVVVQGVLTFDESQLPEFDPNNSEASAQRIEIPARLNGKVLGVRAFDQRFDRSITLVPRCFGPWCPQAKSGQEVLAFVQRKSSVFELTIDPCGGDMIATPSDAQIRELLSCHRGQTCRVIKY